MGRSDLSGAVLRDAIGNGLCVCVYVSVGVLFVGDQKL